MTAQNISAWAMPRNRSLPNFSVLGGDVGSVSLGRGGSIRATFYVDRSDSSTHKLRLARWVPDETFRQRPSRSALSVRASDLVPLYDLIGKALSQARRNGLVMTAPRSRGTRGWPMNAAPREYLPAKQEFLLASMRVASLNLRSWASEVDMIGVALRGGLIGLDDACLHLDDMGILRWLPPDQMVAS